MAMMISSTSCFSQSAWISSCCPSTGTLSIRDEEIERRGEKLHRTGSYVSAGIVFRHSDRPCSADLSGEFENLQFRILVHFPQHHVYAFQDSIFEHILAAPLALQNGQFLQDHDRLRTYLEGEIRDDWAHLSTTYMTLHDFLLVCGNGKKVRHAVPQGSDGGFAGYADFLRISPMYLLRLTRFRTAAKASFR
jgi:hypothetical protein